MKNIEALPITALIPETAKSPIVIYESHAALRMAIVERNSIAALADWDLPGVYCLLYPVAADETFPIYVGQAPSGLRTRVLQHVGKKEDWIRALLIARDTTHGFHSAQVGWLEGRLWRQAFASARGTLVNKNEPKDETLPDYERAALEACIMPIRRVLRLLGYPLEAEDELPSPKDIVHKTFHGVTLSDLLTAGLLSAGQTLHFVAAGYSASATVEPSGKLLMDGKFYDTPSGAGQAIRHRATNGWEHWAVQNAQGNFMPLAEIRTKFVEAKAHHGAASEHPATS